MFIPKTFEDLNFLRILNNYNISKWRLGTEKLLNNSIHSSNQNPPCNSCSIYLTSSKKSSHTTLNYSTISLILLHWYQKQSATWPFLLFQMTQMRESTNYHNRQSSWYKPKQRAYSTDSLSNLGILICSISIFFLRCWKKSRYYLFWQVTSSGQISHYSTISTNRQWIGSTLTLNIFMGWYGILTIWRFLTQYSFISILTSTKTFFLNLRNLTQKLMS